MKLTDTERRTILAQLREEAEQDLERVGCTLGRERVRAILVGPSVIERLRRPT